MLLLALVAFSAAMVPLAGGRLSALATVRLRHAWVLPVTLVVQILIISIVPGGPEDLYRIVHLATYGAAAAFLILNRRVPGLLLIGAGGGLNALAISANGGVMPASRSAVEIAGLAAHDGFVNSGAVANAKLAFLGDVFPVPDWLPLSNVFSVGDVLIVLGAAIALHRVCGSRLVPNRFRAISTS
jgi:hypothetical protein